MQNLCSLNKQHLGNKSNKNTLRMPTYITALLKDATEPNIKKLLQSGLP